MKHALRHLGLLATATVLSWWLLLRPPFATRPGAPPMPPRELEIALTTLAAATESPELSEFPELPEPVDATEEALEEPPTPRESAAPEAPAAGAPAEPAPEAPGPPGAPVTIPIATAERAPSPPPPETGSRDVPAETNATAAAPRDGNPAGALDATPTVADSPTRRDAAAPLQREQARPRTDPELLALAHLELSGEARHGFQSVLLAAPEDQIEIARAFGEELVLVPFSALDPEATAPHYFRLRTDGDARVEAVAGSPPLERFRQYRDLFEYEYARLPAALRDLRRSVLSRSEVFLFAALIPTSEWALVIGRRRAALADAGRGIDDVDRVVLAYRRLGQDAFDIAVERIDFTDGTSFVPTPDPGNRLAED